VGTLEILANQTLRNEVSVQDRTATLPNGKIGVIDGHYVRDSEAENVL
jgi:hypothetical protein